MKKFIIILLFALQSIYSQQITITTPNGGETWFVQDTVTITWQDNIAENVKIMLITNYGNSDIWESFISHSTLSDGHFQWVVDRGNEIDYRIKIESISDLSVYDVSDDVFNILQIPTPTYFSVSAIKDGELVLSWEDNSNIESHYLIERSLVNTGSWEQIAMVDSNVESYTDFNLELNMDYCYRVRAYLENGNHYSYYSEYECASTNAADQIISLTANAIDAQSIQLEWENICKEEHNPGDWDLFGYKIFRRINTSDNWDLIENSHYDTSLSFIDIDLEAYTKYCYRMELRCKDNDEDIFPIITNLACATTLSSAQSNNSDYYPLNIGDKWFYMHLSYSTASPPDTSYFEREILGDTLMQNGIQYKIVEERNRTHFERYDTLTNEIRYYENDWCDGIDKALYSLNYVEDSTVVWKQCELAEQFYTFENNGDSSFIYVDMDNLIVEHTSFRKYLGLFNKSITEGGRDDDQLLSAIINQQEWGLITSVKKDNTKSNHFLLYQNYPNPFNPNTAIEYYLQESSIIKIKLYDSIGNEVETIVNKYQKSGFHKLNYRPNNLASGIYYLRMIADNYSEIRKIILLK